ncbi:MAG TPA: PIN domain-containing protein [Ignavibacteria bacterium]|nr:PIN domain-containing protein [Ignavibacteria bacterium]
MNLLFIDANIYLGFYNSNKPEFKKLLTSLIELKNQIFITDQISNEVNRNKLNIFRQSIDNYLKQNASSISLLPEHLDDSISSSLIEWNKERKVLNKQIEPSNEKLIKILNETLLSVSESQDSVSKELSILFRSAQKPDKKQIARARIRKEKGNPPGKPDDPLGDQITWEILLSRIKKVTSISIVTNDRDYYTEFQGNLFLNAILFKEIKGINPKIEIKLFDKLSEALIEINKKKTIRSLPSKEVLGIIAKDETIIQDLTSEKPDFCQNCSNKNTFTNGSFLRSRYGGLTLQYVCTKCGFRYDTGDPCD